jgi:hypothetical protein
MKIEKEKADREPPRTPRPLRKDCLLQAFLGDLGALGG